MPSLPNPEQLHDEPIPPEDLLPADVIDLDEYRQEQLATEELVAGGGAVYQEETEAPPESTEPRRLSYTSLRKVITARRDPAAFEALVEEYKGFIRYIANGYFLSGGDSEDLAQEALFGFYKAVRDYDGVQSSFRNFAELCMKRQVITAVKTATRRKHEPLNGYVSLTSTPPNSDGDGLTLEDAIPDKSPSPEDRVIGNETFYGLLDVLTGELSYLEHSVLRMYLEGESYEFMAEELFEDTKTVDNALQRARRKVQRYIDSQI